MRDNVRGLELATETSLWSPIFKIDLSSGTFGRPRSGMLKVKRLVDGLRAESLISEVWEDTNSGIGVAAANGGELAPVDSWSPSEDGPDGMLCASLLGGDWGVNQTDR